MKGYGAAKWGMVHRTHRPNHFLHAIKRAFRFADGKYVRLYSFSAESVLFFVSKSIIPNPLHLFTIYLPCIYCSMIDFKKTTKTLSKSLKKHQRSLKMVDTSKKEQGSRSIWQFCCTKTLLIASSSSPSLSPVNKEEEDTPRKPGGWKSIPYILGNETFERLATFGLLGNFTVYLLTQLHMDQVSANNLLNIWSGFTNFAPLLGAFISDAYVGRFRTIVFSSISAFLGMVTVTLTAWIPQLHPPSCTPEQLQHSQCSGPSTLQLGILIMGLGLLSIGTGGIRPCSIPFGVDQFDASTEDGRKGINSFFNLYYATFTIVVMIAVTVVVYIQDSVSWVWGFGIPTALMFCAIILFFLGTRIYVYVMPEGSVFSSVAQVLVAAYKKRGVKISATGEKEAAFYDPPLSKGTVVSKLPLTDQYRFLNKAAMIVDGEVNSDGYPLNKWRLCSVQQVEEVKCLVKIVPIWVSGIICFTAIAQQGTFTVFQALKMDRHLGPKFEIPAGSLAVISMLTIGLWIPFYDRILVPYIRKITKHEGGITLLQRMGIGNVFSILSMIVAGLVEKERRASANLHARPDGIAPMSVMWLAPQLVLMGFVEAFSIIGQIEFYNKQFPEHMRSIANSLFFCTIAGANYLSSLLVTVVHRTTGVHGKPDWLTKNINAGRVDYFYYLVAVMGVFNLFYFLACANRYQYKTSVKNEEALFDVELDLIK